jgi:hypothetical protein
MHKKPYDHAWHMPAKKGIQCTFRGPLQLTSQWQGETWRVYIAPNYLKIVRALSPTRSPRSSLWDNQRSLKWWYFLERALLLTIIKSSSTICNSVRDRSALLFTTLSFLRVWTSGHKVGLGHSRKSVKLRPSRRGWDSVNRMPMRMEISLYALMSLRRVSRILTWRLSLKP